MRRFTFFLLLILYLGACAPKEPVVLRKVEIVELLPGKDGNPILKANAILYNPNKGSLRLKAIELDIFLDGKSSANIDQKMNARIGAEADFTVPLEVQLNFKDTGLLDKLLGMIGGKKSEIRFVGKLKVSVGGFAVRIPIDYKGQIRL